ncbi:MAG TPA: hypothetical protein VIQ77_12135 [Mucilaginibacter sp.]|jgi:hypothetical protein
MKKLISLTVLFVLACTCVFAQDVESKKLNSVQIGSVLAPEKVKIDGKLNEWNNDFKAYNRSTRILYILSNDEKNMYLAVKSTDFTTKAKIIAGGVDLIINANGKKKDKDAPSVTFPVIEHPERLGGNISDHFENRNAGADTALMHQLHQRTIIAAKKIRVLGIKTITDTLISIYNMDGIKTALNFDKDGGLTLEMAIPLKSINLSAAYTRELAYHIVLNGFQPEWGGGPSGPGGNSGPNTLNMFDLMTPSDFWGKYTLAKKL